MADAGVARILQETLRLQPATVVGTTNYMAPELFEADAAAGLTTAQDIWSAACVVPEMFTGKMPFAGLSFQVRVCLCASVRACLCVHLR